MVYVHRCYVLVRRGGDSVCYRFLSAECEEAAAHSAPGPIPHKRSNNAARPRIEA